jgi:hypothetical protein
MLMPKVKDGCPRCKSDIFILGDNLGEELRKVVCPICFLPFMVRMIGVNRKSGLPQGERYEVDPREVV